VESGLVTREHQASFRAAAAPHSGDWLYALPFTSCGLRMDDESVRVAVGLRLGCNVCVPHACVCGTQVDACGTHAFVCKRIARHQALNDVVARAFVSAGVPVTKEPVGLARQRWQATRRLDANSVAARQALDLGRHSGAHASGLLCERDGSLRWCSS